MNHQPLTQRRHPMSDFQGPKVTNIKINPDNLYREEVFTDMTYATIRRLSPVKIDGTPDDSREPLFTGMAQLMSPNGPIPVQCLIEGAKTLPDAADKLPDAIEKAVQAMIAEAQEAQRQEESRIVMPGQ